MKQSEFVDFANKVEAEEGLKRIISNTQYNLSNYSTSWGSDQYYLCCAAYDITKYCKKNWSKEDFALYFEDAHAEMNSNPDYWMHRLFLVIFRTYKLNLQYERMYQTFIPIKKADRTNSKYYAYVRRFNESFQARRYEL